MASAGCGGWACAGGAENGCGRGHHPLFARRQGTARQPFNAKSAKDFDAESAKNSPAAGVSRKVRQVREGTAENQGRGGGRQGQSAWWPFSMMQSRRCRICSSAEGAKGETPASAARSGLAWFLLHKPGVSLCSTPGCSLAAASRLPNRLSPGLSSSCWPQMHQAAMRLMGGAIWGLHGGGGEE